MISYLKDEIITNMDRIANLTEPAKPRSRIQSASSASLAGAAAAASASASAAAAQVASTIGQGDHPPAP